MRDLERKRRDYLLEHAAEAHAVVIDQRTAADLVEWVIAIAAGTGDAVPVTAPQLLAMMTAAPVEAAAWLHRLMRLCNALKTSGGRRRFGEACQAVVNDIVNKVGI